MASLSPQAVTALKERVDAACADQEKGIPGAVVVVVGKDGKEHFAHASGKRGYGSEEPMTLDRHIYDMLQPLIHQSGEKWEYGVNIDWAGIMVERVTGLPLNDYFHRNIFKPLGLNNISMFAPASMKEKLIHMNQRDPQGHISGREHLFRRPLTVQTSEDIKTCFNSGGAGCFAKPQEYCHRLLLAEILATLLNDGTSPITGKRILDKATVEEMFRNQIPNLPNFAAQGIPPSKPDLTNAIAHLYPSPTPQGWGLPFMLTGGPTGRSEGTAHWAGLANLWWWCDREKGVTGMVCTQLLPFADPQVWSLWLDVESAVYRDLVQD
ncbi:hypothetical protein Aspvir_004391 [Aspergillus viridinutans]|uniref:Beta-lactamase-related domain-containing protein n=1 Tax=Aspergillus viridinutans TaxID=75553 RepID=A0A9P3BPY8_ASPVI|nr:uncharacterized protein Aspvir_004391 [Aspergillus viridinutans]GIK00368.1 hypothetical protein Aspvir_004391 [Aspergillus viridinutans]